MTRFHTSDLALVREMLRGRESAFETFFENTFPSLYRFALRRLGGDRTAAEEVAQEVERRGVSPDRILVTPNGVDTDLFTPDAPGSEVRDRYRLGDSFVLGWIGSFHRFHGLDLAIDAAALLQDDLPDLTLLLVGDGLDRPRIEALARDRGLRNVVFTGTIDHSEIPSHIAAMDASLVLSPDDDAFHYSPLKLKEYMACGTPTIAPRVGEIPQVVSDGEDGLLVEPGDADAIASAGRRLHADPELRAAMGAAARSKMVRDGSWERRSGGRSKHLDGGTSGDAAAPLFSKEDA